MTRFIGIKAILVFPWGIIGRIRHEFSGEDILKDQVGYLIEGSKLF